MKKRLPVASSCLVWLTLALVALDGARAAAQAEPERVDVDESIVAAEASSDAAASEAAASDGAGGFWGSRSPRRRIIPALWGMHFFDRQSLRPFWTRGGGWQANGWFVGVFENSYDDLSVIAGVEREWGAWRAGWFGIGTGYRAGLITGYDGQLISIADKTPVLPFVGLDVWLQTGPLGVDVFYVYRALSVEAWIRY